MPLKIWNSWLLKPSEVTTSFKTVATSSRGIDPALSKYKSASIFPVPASSVSEPGCTIV